MALNELRLTRMQARRKLACAVHNSRDLHELLGNLNQANRQAKADKLKVAGMLDSQLPDTTARQFRKWGIDLDGLPTFGGSAPPDAENVLSWNEHCVLVGDDMDNLEIVSRDTWDATPGSAG